MRTVFNGRQETIRVAIRSAAILAAACAFGVTSKAAAETNYFTTRSVLAKFFPRSTHVGYQTVTLTAPSKARIVHRLGYTPVKDRYTIFVASTGSNVDGYAIIDDELGEHQPITFATKLSPRGVIEGVEIVAYREPRGDEVRDLRFCKQFIGKTSGDPLRLNRDIDAVSGATISSSSLAVGVRRAAVLIDELVFDHVTLAIGAAVPTRVVPPTEPSPAPAMPISHRASLRTSLSRTRENEKQK